MKKWIAFFVILNLRGLAFISFSQDKIKEAILKTSVTTLRGNHIISESKLTTYFKEKKLKISVLNLTGKNDIYIDRLTGKVVSLYDFIGGKKLGFFTYDTDSITKQNLLNLVLLNLTDSIKTINGFECRLGILHYGTALKMKDVRVWYNPDLVFDDPTLGVNILGVEKINGVPVLVESEDLNGIKTIYTVLSIDRRSKIASKALTIPKGYLITTQEEFQEEVKKMSKQ